MVRLGKVEAFKNELRNYDYYTKKLNDLNNQIELNFYTKTGVSGISYDKIPSHPSEEAIANFRLTLIEQGDQLAIERDRIVKQLNYITTTLDKLDKPFKTVVQMIYIRGYSYERVAKMVNWSPSGLYGRVEKELKKIL